jgi:hypothetical protein
VKKIPVFIALTVFAIALIDCATKPAPAAAPVPKQAPAGLSAVVIPKLKIDLVPFESFESTPFWYAIGDSWKDGDQSKDAVQSDKNSTDGAFSLECSFDMAAGKAATFAEDEPEMNDWTGVKSVLVDVFNPLSANLKLALAVGTGTDWFWQETDVVILLPGANNDIKFDLLTKRMKSAKTNWSFAADIENPNAVRRVVFKLFTDEPAKGSVFLDDIRLVK